MNLKNSEKKEKSIVELTIEVKGDEFKEATSAAYRKQRGSITVPGFRKGKAPRNIIERLYGESFFWEEAVNQSYPAAYDAAVKEAGLEPVGVGNMEVSEINAEGYTFIARVPVMPEVSVEDYKGIEAVKMPVEVTDTDIDAEIERLRDRNSRLISVERAAQNGDTVILDFDGSVDGVPFDGGKAEKFTLVLGSGSFIPGFEEKVEGHSAGEEFDIDVTFPADYHAENLAGKDAVFKIKLHEVQENDRPALDDEFVKDVSEFDTLDELKESIRKDITERRQKDADSMFENAVLEQFAEKVVADIPDAMIDAEAENVLENQAYQMSQSGIPFETYLKITGATVESMLAEMRPNAEKRVRIQLGLKKIAEDAGIEITEEEIEAQYKKLADQYNMEVDQVKQSLDDESIKTDLLRVKASELVTAAAVAKEPEAPKTEETAAEEAAEEKAE